MDASRRGLLFGLTSFAGAVGMDQALAGLLFIKGKGTITQTFNALILQNPTGSAGVAGSSIILNTTSGSSLTMTNTVGGKYSVAFVSPNWVLSWTSGVTVGTDAPAVDETRSGYTTRNTVFGVAINPAATMLAPASAWTGAVDSGWGVGTTNGNYAKPSVPGTRTVARPALRPVFLQHHFITGIDGTHYLVFSSQAKGGIQKVRISMEGNFLDFTPGQRSWVSYTDLRGVTRRLFGYVAPVDWTAAQAAHANGRASVCAESWANNGSYQKQVVVGRVVHFRPGSGLVAGERYDEVKTVGAGQNYATLPLALDYAWAQATANPNKYIGIKIMDSGNHRPELPNSHELVNCTHATEIFANSGVTAMCGGSYGANGTCNFTLDGTRLRGPGITHDISSGGYATTNDLPVASIRLNNGSGKVVQCEGIEIYCGNANGGANWTGSGATLLYKGQQRGAYWVANTGVGPNSNHLEFKDNYAHDMDGYGLGYCETSINNDQTNVSGSASENVWALTQGGTLDKIGGYWNGMRVQKTALTITYGGAGVASSSFTSTSNGSTWPGNGSNGFLNLYVDGAFIASFSSATYPTNLTMAGAINALGGGFSATYDATNVARGMNYLSRATLQPTDALYPPVNFSGGSTVLTTIYDIHADAIVNFGGGSLVTFSNWICEFIEQTDLVGTAPWSMDDTAEMEDAIYNCINARDTSAANGQVAQRGYLSGNMRHCGFINVSNQGPGAGHYFGGTTADPDTFWLNGYDFYIYYAHAYDPDMNWDGLAMNGLTLPTGAVTNCVTLGGVSESTYIDSTGVPVLNGALKTTAGAYRSAKVPTALRVDSPTGNYGWNLAA